MSPLTFRRLFRMKFVDVSLIFCTFLSIVTYEYSCQPANITTDQWEEWIQSELWKLILAEAIAVFSYLYIFFYCFGLYFCKMMIQLISPGSISPSKIHCDASLCSKSIGFINFLIVVAYAFSPGQMDTIPNNHSFYNKAGLRYALPLLYVLLCLIYIIYYIKRPKLVLSLFVIFVTLCHFMSNRPYIESVKYNSSSVYCSAPVRRDLLKLHQVITTLVESIPYLYTCEHTFDVSWMDKLNGKPQLLAYPNVTLWGLNEGLSPSMQILGKNVLEQSINLYANVSKIAEHELVISRMGRKPSVLVKTVRRSDIPLKPEKANQENLFILFLDGVSRPFAETYLPKTIRLLQSWHRDLGVRHHTYLRYQHFPGRSRGNRTPFFVGYSYEYLCNQTSFSRSTFPKMFQSADFVTGYVSSSCEMGFWGPMAANSTWLSNVPRSYFVDAYHHHMLFCDVNFIDLKQPIRPDKGPWAVGKHCMYGKQLSQLAGDYASSFFRTYYDRPKFMYIDLIEMHDTLGSNLESLDESLFRTFNSLQAFTVNTTFVIHADHSHQTLLDKHNHLPYLSIIRPPHHKIPPQADTNQQKLYTVFDLRSTILDIFFFTTSREQEVSGRNLYSDILPSRNCKEAGIPYETCLCL